MRITSLIRNSFQYCKIKQDTISKRVYRVAMNSLMITNNCLITSMFFSKSNIITGLVLGISIISSAFFIERIYGKNKI